MTIKCDMTIGCAESVTHVDSKGFVYCAAHAARRRGGGVSVRKLRPSEIEKLGRELLSYRAGLGAPVEMAIALDAIAHSRTNDEIEDCAECGEPVAIGDGVYFMGTSLKHRNCLDES